MILRSFEAKQQLTPDNLMSTDPYSFTSQRVKNSRISEPPVQLILFVRMLPGPGEIPIAAELPRYCLSTQ